ncbi:hypothetical protein K438DRAFT_1758819 [Mycena galopus ATCC 62051]|nr:hypothetical protein K438DRAFT_1758819 [Mycena galopus ATCC 62051]
MMWEKENREKLRTLNSAAQHHVKVRHRIPEKVSHAEKKPNENKKIFFEGAQTGSARLTGELPLPITCVGNKTFGYRRSLGQKGGSKDRSTRFSDFESFYGGPGKNRAKGLLLTSDMGAVTVPKTGTTLGASRDTLGFQKQSLTITEWWRKQFQGRIQFVMKKDRRTAMVVKSKEVNAWSY